jgi:HK97 family phage prohead protease
MPDNELRLLQGAELRALDGGTLEGYAARYAVTSHDLGGFVERIAPGAFARSLRQDVVALFAHDQTRVLGRTGSKTLKLTEDNNGLRFKLSLGKSSFARDLADSVARGDLSECSFGFTVPKGGDQWDYKQSPALRTLHDVNLLEISLGVAWPAYPNTSTQLRQALGGISESVRIGRYVANGEPSLRDMCYEIGKRERNKVSDAELDVLRQRLRLRQKCRA